MDNRTVIADLQEHSSQIAGGYARHRFVASSGVPEIDSLILKGGFALGASNETASGVYDVTTGVVSALLSPGMSQSTRASHLLLSRSGLDAAAFVQVSLDMYRMIFVETKDGEGVIECDEAARRYGGVDVADLIRLHIVASRRFQLAVNDRARFALLFGAGLGSKKRQTSVIRQHRHQGVAYLPSEAVPVSGFGHHRWFCEVMRIRAAESFKIEVSACNATGHMTSIEKRNELWSAAR